jgi:two-component system alkaline phosphatase synthesis response regulator PhoP
MAEEIHVLAVDDERGIRFFLRKTLERSGYSVATASSGKEALELVRDTFFDLILLDLRLNGQVDGLQVLERVRWRWPAAAVVILTAHGSLDSAMAAIREGVDGYLTKPVEPDELRIVAREALERRRNLVRPPAAGEAETLLQQGPFYLNLKEHTAHLDGRELELTPQEYDLLAHFVRNPHRVASPIELVKVVRDYQPQHVNEARDMIKWYIHRLRQKIEPEPAQPRYIVNVRGVGYRFEA